MQLQRVGVVSISSIDNSIRPPGDNKSDQDQEKGARRLDHLPPFLAQSRPSGGRGPHCACLNIRHPTFDPFDLGEDEGIGNDHDGDGDPYEAHGKEESVGQVLGAVPHA